MDGRGEVAVLVIRSRHGRDDLKNSLSSCPHIHPALLALWQHGTASSLMNMLAEGEELSLAQPTTSSRRKCWSHHRRSNIGRPSPHYWILMDMWTAGQSLITAAASSAWSSADQGGLTKTFGQLVNATAASLPQKDPWFSAVEMVTSDSPKELISKTEFPVLFCCCEI